MKNKYAKRASISEAKIREIVRYVAADLTALQAAALSGLNRNTVNRLYRGVRERMLLACEAQRRLLGVVEVDESFFGARRRSGLSRSRGRAARVLPCRAGAARVLSRRPEAIPGQVPAPSAFPLPPPPAGRRWRRSGSRSTRTVYVVPLARPSIVWRVADPGVTVVSAPTSRGAGIRASMRLDPCLSAVRRPPLILFQSPGS